MNKDERKVPELRFKGFHDDWEQRKLGTFYDFKNGLNKGKEFFGSGTPIVNFTDVFHNRRIYSKNLKGKVELNVKEINRFKVESGDIFFTRTSETIDQIGYPSVLMDESKDTVFSGFVLRGRAIETDPLVNTFKSYVFFTESFRREMITKSSMTTRALTTGGALKGMTFNFPINFSEQRRIGALLSTLDNVLSLHQRKVNILSKQKEVYFRKILVEKNKNKPILRFKNFHKEWNKDKLENLFEYGGSGGTPKSTVKEYYEGNIPFLSISDISNSDGYIEHTEKSISKKGLDNSAAWIVPKGAISLAMYASVGKLAILNIEVATSQAFYNMAFKDDNLRNFVYQSLLKTNELNEWDSLVSTGTQRNLNANKVKKFTLYIPSNVHEIIKVSEVLMNIDKVINLHQGKLDNLIKLKTMYLNKMFI